MVLPAAPGTGIRFRWRRRSADAAQDIPCHPAIARFEPFCSALALQPAPGIGDPPLLRTPEHILAALLALQVDDAVVDILGAAEVPILDGSALPWCRAILEAGIEETKAPRIALRPRGMVEVVDQDRFIRAEPAGELVFDVSLPLGGFGAMRWQGRPLGQVFVAELAAARSFGRVKWALPIAVLSRLRRQPVLRGAHFWNTAPLYKDRILGGERLPQEPVRHRALDVLGDLGFVGQPLLARISAHRFTHGMAQELARLLLAPGACDAVTTLARPAGA